MLKSILLVAVTLLVPAIVLAGTYYRYTTDSGSTAFADKLESIPERYRGDAEEIPAQSLFDYERTTITEKQPEVKAHEFAPSGSRFDASADAGRGVHTDSGVVIQIDPGVRLTVPEDDDSEPIRVHKRHYTAIETGATQVRTQITRNGQVLVDITEDQLLSAQDDYDDFDMPHERSREDD